MTLARDGKRGELVVTGKNRGNVVGVLESAQAGDGAVLAVEVGQGSAASQSCDGLQGSIVVAAQFLDRGATGDVERCQVIGAAVQISQCRAVAAIQGAEIRVADDRKCGQQRVVLAIQVSEMALVVNR